MHKSEFDAHAVSHVEIADRKIEADASVFFQSNLGLLPELVESVRKAVDEGLASGKSSDAWLIDLFSGVGFFACILQDKFKKITTVEREEGCLKHAKVNLSVSTASRDCAASRTPEIENVSAPAEDWLVENVVDVPATLIVDPPRTGLPKEALTAIVKSSVNRLIYVSCDPVTLARDFAKFSEAGFALSHAEGFAFYPQTPHLEMMFVLDR
jgi:23S rRNA (uracil1939-C5)-methyltransferase